MTRFNPAKHLRKLKGSDYLEVKWRLVWLRDAHPTAHISTTLLEHQAGSYAVFSATITLPDAAGSATAHGMEERSDFGDYLEKAETKAVGRALVALGFGTQFADDFNFEQDTDKPVDSPVQRPLAAPVRQAPPAPRAEPPRQPITRPATPEQVARAARQMAERQAAERARRQQQTGE